jgi:hypothetical protein
MRIPILGFIATLALTIAAPAVASADTGAITAVGSDGHGQLDATFTTTSTTCTPDGYCGWFPEASQVGAGQPCNTTDLIYVGDVQGDVASQTDAETFYPVARAVRLCLYIYGPDGAERLVAQYDYAPPAPPRAPPALKVRTARARLPGILRSAYHSHFRHRTHFRRACSRYSTQKVRCTVRWDSGKWRYHGAVSMRRDPDDAGSILYWTNIHRKRIHAAPAHQPPPLQNCDPNYSGCLDPNASDYDCAGGSGNGPLYTGEVVVLGDDHYDLDADGDGTACEDD